MVDSSRRAFLRGRPAPGSLRIAVAPSCLAQRGVECRVCAEACDPRALRFTPARGGVAQLRIQLELCTGCGDCVPVCPVGALQLTVPPPTTPENPAGAEPAGANEA